MNAQILFSGYYGLGNAGDEAVLDASVELFRRERPTLALSVLSGNVAETQRRLRLRAVPRFHPVAVLAAVRASDLVLSGGGSLLQDRTSMKSLLYYLSVLILAKRLGKKSMVFAQGIGPLVSARAQQMTARVLRVVDAITVRDAESADLLRSLGVADAGGPEVEVTADPVFALDPAITDRVRAAAGERPMAAVSLRPWPGVEQILEPLAEAFRPYQGTLGLQLWPLHPQQDLELCRKWAGRMPDATIVEERLEPAEWMALAGWVDAVVGMRLHALIFGAARATRVLGISYDPKVDALLNRLRARPCGTVDRLDVDALQAGLESVFLEDDPRWKDRQARAGHLREAAIRNVTQALLLLE